MKRRYLLYIVFIAIWFIFRSYPQCTEIVYSCGIYPYIAKTLHLLLGWIPFSVGDILYTLLIGYAIVFLIKNIKNIWKRPLWFLDKVVFFTFSVVFCFFLLWGFNYFRIPLEKSLGIDTRYTEEELFQATEILIHEANKLHEQLTPNDTTKVSFSLSKQQIYTTAWQSFPLGIENITDFSTKESVKTSIYSTFLTYMGYSGYINPFTNESQINGRMIGYSLPITACHEIAHQMGYAAEQEANYLGYLAAAQSDNLLFKYSASLFALRYLLNETHKTNEDKYKTFVPKIRKGILKNYKEVRDFWLQHENIAEPIFKASYDAFLKANNQAKGIQSYNFVVGLLIKLKLKQIKNT